MTGPVKLAVWVVGVIVGLLVLFILFEYVIPSILPTSF